MIQDTIIEAYNREVENSQKPGYVPTEMDTE
jgi:hypothetical protein